jgi:hypothetical protein
LELSGGVAGGLFNRGRVGGIFGGGRTASGQEQGAGATGKKPKGGAAEIKIHGGEWSFDEILTGNLSYPAQIGKGMCEVD